jgi:class 3 adenylate cyclase/tetratricopeptide (TPR) repeat protein/energy-coupling factor transporter ATP-binding protein EcfA2
MPAAVVTGQLRSLTVLVCDMVGSTDMRVRLGADGERLFHLHEQLARESAAAHHGTFVKSLGDGAMAVFAAAADAVSAAVLLQRQIDNLHRRGEALDLNVRTGVSAGDVTIGEDDCHGVSVAEAFRLCDAAGAGEILVADIVRALARGLTAPLTAAGEFDLKGLDEPLAAWRVEWGEHTEDWTSVPVPSRVTPRHEGVFVGRDLELFALLEPARTALAGDTRELVLLSGEPGVGKSALARQAARFLHDETGAVVMHGGCDEELRPPYQPFVQALRHLVRHAPTTALVDYVHRYGGDLGLLVPELAERIGRLPEPQTTAEAADRYLLFAAVSGLLEVALRDVPLVLLLDDLHWADRGTTLLLKHLLVTTELTGLVIIATLRHTEPEDDNGLADLIAELRRVNGVRRIDVEGLPSDEVRDLVASMLRGASQAIAAIADAVHRETDGNAFFVVEMVRHMLETGADVSGGPLPELPVGIREVVQQRIRRMGADTQTVLAAGAVLGAEFEWRVLSQLLDMKPDALLDVLDGAVAAAILREVPGRSSYRFVHALVQHTLYDGLSETRRRRLHVAAALALDARADVHAAAAAAHWLAAGDLAEPAAVRAACVAAASEALRHRAPDEAVKWLANALATAPDDRERCGLLVALGEAQRLAGDATHHDTLLGAGALAQRINDVEHLAAAALANTRWFSSSVGSGDPAELKLLEASLAAIGPDPSPTRARLLATLAGELVYSDRPGDRFDAADEALAIARGIGDDLTLFDVLFWRSTSARPRDGSWRDGELAELISIAERGSDPLRRAMAHMVTVMRGIHVGDISGAEAALARAADLADELRLPILRWLVTIVRGNCVTLSGELGGAEKIVQEAFELSQATDQPDALIWYGVQLYMIRYQQDRLNEIIPLFAGGSTQTPTLLTWHAALAMAYAETGELEQAAQVAARLTSAGYASHPEEPHWLIGMSCLGTALAAVGGDRAEMRLVYDGLSSRAHLWSSIMPLSLGSNERVLGELALALGDLDMARGHLERAVEANDAGPSPVFTARSRALLVGCLRQQGVPADSPVVAALVEATREACNRHDLIRVRAILDAALT